MDPPPRCQLRGGARLVRIPVRQLAQGAGVSGLTGVLLQVILRFGPEAQRPSRLGAPDQRAIERGDAGECDIEHALGFARIAAPQTERAEPEVGVSQRGVHGQGFRVPSEGDEIVVRRLVLVRLAQELQGRLGGIRTRRVGNDRRSDREQEDRETRAHRTSV